MEIKEGRFERDSGAQTSRQTDRQADRQTEKYRQEEGRKRDSEGIKQEAAFDYFSLSEAVEEA